MDTFCCYKSQGSSYGSGKGKINVGHAMYGFSLVKGKANDPMEDYHVAKFVQFQGRELGLFAIYDGHLGDSVPSYLQKHLLSIIVKQEDFWADPSRSIAKAYERTEQMILSYNPELGRGESTAVNSILIDCRRILVANVGDSREVLSRKVQALQMTIDHLPNTKRDDIENRGGFVSFFVLWTKLLFFFTKVLLTACTCTRWIMALTACHALLILYSQRAISCQCNYLRRELYVADDIFCSAQHATDGVMHVFPQRTFHVVDDIFLSAHFTLRMIFFLVHIARC